MFEFYFKLTKITHEYYHMIEKITHVTYTIAAPSYKYSNGARASVDGQLSSKLSSHENYDCINMLSCIIIAQSQLAICIKLCWSTTICPPLIAPKLQAF